MHDISDLRTLAKALDSKFTGPFGFKFGWDGLLGMIPVAGDVVTNIMSLYIVGRAAQVGCPPGVLFRMGLNLLLENVIDIIPFFGNLFDFVWKANTKNLALVERYLAEPKKTERRSWLLILLVLLLLIVLMVGSIVLSFQAVIWVIEKVSGSPEVIAI